MRQRVTFVIDGDAPRGGHPSKPGERFPITSDDQFEGNHKRLGAGSALQFEEGNAMVSD